MRILAVTNLYPNPAQPHRAPFNRQQFRLLARTHPLHVIAPIAWTDRGVLRHVPRNRRVALDGLTIDHPTYYFPPKIARGWYGHCFRASIRRTFARVAAEFRPEIVFAPWAYPDGWAAVQLGHALGLPVVLQVHGSDVKLLDQYPARKQRTAEAVRAADGVVAVSEDLARALAALGVKREKIRVVIDGVDPVLFHPGPRPVNAEPVILFVGNLVPVKNVDVLLTSVAQLMHEQHPVRVVIIGAGPLRPSLERQAADLGLAARVQFVGAVPQADLPRWYHAADLVVLPSRSEGVPNVLLEASACGTPWVASAVGGIPEIAHLGASRLVPPNDPAALAAAIAQTLANPPLERPPGPRPRDEAVAEVEAFLEEVRNRGPH